MTLALNTLLDHAARQRDDAQAALLLAETQTRRLQDQAAQLRAYRSGERATDPNQMMRDMARHLSDEEIDAVASFMQGLR